MFITNSRSFLKLMSIELVMPSNHLILCHSLLLLLSIFPSIRVFSKESVLCIWWPKYWSFSFSISPSNDYSGLISFRIGCFDLLAIQGTLKSSPAPQFKSINSSALSRLFGPTHIHGWHNSSPFLDWWVFMWFWEIGLLLYQFFSPFPQTLLCFFLNMLMIYPK